MRIAEGTKAGVRYFWTCCQALLHSRPARVMQHNPIHRIRPSSKRWPSPAKRVGTMSC